MAQSETCHMLCHQIAVLLGLERWPHPQIGWLSSAEPTGEVSPLLRLVSHYALFFWELCGLRCSCCILHPLFLESLGPLISATWEALSPGHFSTADPASRSPPHQRGSRKRATHPACKLCLLQPFKLRCRGVSREGLESVTLFCCVAV